MCGCECVGVWVCECVGVLVCMGVLVCVGVNMSEYVRVWVGVWVCG